MLRENLERWLRRRFYSTNEEISRVELYHLGVTGKLGSKVEAFKIESTEESQIGVLIDDVERAAEIDASGFDTVQKYALLAFNGDESKPISRLVFRMASESESYSEQSEPPTTNGVMAQMLRHNEAIMRTSTVSMQQTFNAQQAMISQQADAIEKLARDRLDTVVMIETLLSQKHEREMDMMKLASSEENKRAIIGKIGPLVAIAANKISGKNMLPAADPMRIALKELFNTLTPEQLNGLAQVLSPEQTAVVLTLANDFVGGDASDKKPE